MVAHSTFKLGKVKNTLKPQFLCPVASRYNALDFHNAPWAEIENMLSEVYWSHMEDLSETNTDAALSCFHEKVLSILEQHGPKKKVRTGKPRFKMHKMRRLLSRKLAKLDSKLQQASTMQRKSKLLA